MDMTEQFRQIRAESEKEHVCNLIGEAIRREGSAGRHHARIPVDLTRFPEIRLSLEDAGFEAVQYMADAFELIW
jgi:hypothetical protein